MSIKASLIDFSRAYDAKQSREGQALLCIMATGGAMSISGLGLVPGASGRLAATYHPYSIHELFEFVKPVLLKSRPNATEEEWRSVHADSALFYLEALKVRHPGNYLYVASTAALETTRRRRGENVSYIAMRRPNGVETSWKVHFMKKEDRDVASGLYSSPEEAWNANFRKADGSINMDVLAARRIEEDEKMTKAIMALILDDPSFARLDSGDKIIQLTQDADAMETVWAEQR